MFVKSRIFIKVATTVLPARTLPVTRSILVRRGHVTELLNRKAALIMEKCSRCTDSNCSVYTHSTSAPTQTQHDVSC